MVWGLCSVTVIVTVAGALSLRLAGTTSTRSLPCSPGSEPRCHQHAVMVWGLKKFPRKDSRAILKVS